MRCITSEPAPVPIMIGMRPATMTATVIAFGRTRKPAPFANRFHQIVLRHLSSSNSLLPSMLEIEQHDDAKLRRDTRQRNETNGTGYGSMMS